MQAQCFQANAPAEVIMQAEYGAGTAVFPAGMTNFVIPLSRMRRSAIPNYSFLRLWNSPRNKVSGGSVRMSNSGFWVS
jgi:hypothetical protein